jgi:opacity protein-like surface antigen
VKKLLLGGIFLSALLGADTALAAPVHNWTGCYIGVHGGGGGVASTWFDPYAYGGGGLAGGQIGCNVQAGSIVGGIEVEGWWSGLDQRQFFSNGTETDNITAQNRWDVAASARVGVAFDRALIYGKAGIAWSRVDFVDDERFAGGVFDVTNGSRSMPGLLLGAGFEYALTPNWSAKLEYNYIQFVRSEVALRHCDDTGACDDSTESHSASKQIVKLGFNYKLNGWPSPVPPPSATGASGAPFSWTGCYVGVHGGGGLIKSPFVVEDDFGGGGLAGGQLGCNLQSGMMVFGVEGEAWWSNMAHRDAFSNPGEIRETTAQNRWDVTLAARFGVAVGRALFYGKAGVARGRVDYEDRDSFPPLPFVVTRGSATQMGLLLGAGVEYGLTANWSTKLEYNYINYALTPTAFTTCDEGNCTDFTSSESAQKHLVKIGLNYRFGGQGSAPAQTSAAPIYNWTGCYIGAHGGGGMMTSTFHLGLRDESYAGGFVGGGQLGCNYQAGMAVFGVEGEAWWSGILQRTVAADAIGGFEGSVKNRWGADIAVRAGVAFDRALIYGKAGIARGPFDFAGESNATGVGTVLSLLGSANLTGLLLGGGVEYAFAPNWSAKIEYDYINFTLGGVPFNECFIFVGCFDNATALTARQQIVKTGLNYRFGGQNFAPREPMTLHNWTGCYLGIHGGGGIGATNYTDLTESGKGALAGGQLGCNYQVGRIVFGLEAEGWWSGIVQKQFFSDFIGVTSDTATNRWDIDIAARLGVAAGRALWYGKAGVASGRFDFATDNNRSVPSTTRGSGDLTGLLLGAGVEYAIDPDWSAKFEYNYINFFNEPIAFTQCDGFGCDAFTDTFAANKQVVKLGLNYRFSAPR